MLNVNQSAFLELTTLSKNHGWSNGTNGGHQLGGGDLGLLPLPLWPTNVAWTVCCVSFMAVPGVPRLGFFATSRPTYPPIPPQPTSPSIPPTLSISNTDVRKGCQKYHEIQPPVTKKVSYNKNQWITMYFSA